MRVRRKLALLGLLLPWAAHATSYVPITDSALADQASVIVQATVVAIEPAPTPGTPSTDYFVQVEQVVKGYVAGSTVVVRVAGGIGTDGLGLRIWGSPTFHLYERTLLFLTPRSDGTYAVLHLMLGAFREVQVGGHRLAVRSLSEAVELIPWSAEAADLGEGSRLRDFGAFVEWLGDRAAGRPSSAGYWVGRPEVLEPLAGPAPQLLMDPCSQLNFRWFAFDRGDEVAWSFDRRGTDGRGAGEAAFRRARRAWNRDPGTFVRLVGKARGGPGPGFARFDGVNTVKLNDRDDEIAGSFRCSTGGVVAVTGVWFNNGRSQECLLSGAAEKGSYRERWFLDILGADILTNDGSGCLLAGNHAAAAEVFGHELGHSLGLAHLPSLRSLMNGLVREDGRGAQLGAEDREAASSLYGTDPSRDRTPPAAD